MSSKTGPPTDPRVKYLCEAAIRKLNSPVASLPVLGFRRPHPRYVPFSFPEALSERTEDCVHLCSVFLNLQKHGTCLTPWIIMESGVQYAVGSLLFPTWEVGYLDSSTTSVFTASNPLISPPRTKPRPTGCHHLHHATEMGQSQSKRERPVLRAALRETAQDFMH